MSSVDRTTAPAPGPLRDFHFPAVERSALLPEFPLDVVRLPRLPVATALLVLPAGEDTLPEARGGLAVLAGDALEGGTGSRDGAALAEALEALGADLDVGTGWNATTVSLSCLADHLPEALALLAEMVLDPAFPEDEVARMLEQQRARVRQRTMDPTSMANDAFARAVFAEGEPYARPLLGSVESLEDVDPSTLRGYAEGYYRPRGGGLVVTGDVDPGDVEALARRLLGDWGGAPPSRAVPAGEPRSRTRRVVVVDRPGAVQSEIRIGHVGVPRSTPNYETLVVATAILGGTFSSRLNLNLRERHGFTYGVRARNAYRRGPGAFSISTAVDTAVTARAVQEAVQETEAYVASGPTQEEVDSVRDYLAGIFPLRLETTGQVAGRVAELLVYDLPSDTWAQHRDRIRAVTRESAHQAVQSLVRPQELVVTVVGDAQAVAGELEGLDLGPVEVQTPSQAG